MILFPDQSYYSIFSIFILYFLHLLNVHLLLRLKGNLILIPVIPVIVIFLISYMINLFIYAQTNDFNGHVLL